MEHVLQNKRILIVEDNVSNMAVYNALLRHSGATVIQDFMNADAVNILTRHLPIDVILMDLMLRFGISGYSLVERIKTIPSLADIPIIAVSASDPELEIPRAKAGGFAGFIGKPIDPILFPQQIADCMAGKQVWYSQIAILEKITWPTRHSSSTTL